MLCLVFIPSTYSPDPAFLCRISPCETRHVPSPFLFLSSPTSNPVLALFLGSQAILMMLVAFLLAQVSSMVVSAQFSIRANQYTPSCWVTRVSPGNAFFRYSPHATSEQRTYPGRCSATTMTTHIVIFFMTFWRFFRLPKEFTHQGLGRTVFRDSTFTLAAISSEVRSLVCCVMLMMTGQ